MTTARRLATTAALAALALLVAAAPAEAKKKKAKAGELPAELCHGEDVKLGPRALTVEVDFADAKVEQKVREKGSLCFDYGGARYRVTPSLSKDRMGFVDMKVERKSADGELGVDLQFHVHGEEFLDAANNWPELVRFEVVRVVPPLNRSMVAPRGSGSVIRQ